MINIFYDIETTGPSPTQHEICALAMIATDEDYNELGRFEEYCRPEGDRIATNVFGREYSKWPDATGSSNPAIRNATDVHGISWERAKDFQLPIELYRKLWTFINSLPDEPIRLIFHSESKFDYRFLFYRCSLHAPAMYMALNKRTHFYEYDDSESITGVYRLRYDDTMGMARKYIKRGSDGLKIAAKLEKTIEKNRTLLTKDRKTPAKAEQIQKWQDALATAENDLLLMEFSHKELSGYALNKICTSLDIKLNHHNAMSDAEVLIPIHKFLSSNLS